MTLPAREDLIDLVTQAMCDQRLGSSAGTRGDRFTAEEAKYIERAIPVVTEALLARLRPGWPTEEPPDVVTVAPNRPTLDLDRSREIDALRADLKAVAEAAEQVVEDGYNNAAPATFARLRAVLLTPGVQAGLK